MHVYAVEAEHQTTPGRVFKLFRSESAANAEAIELTNIMLKDAGRKPQACLTTWCDYVERLQDEYGAAHCYVEVSRMEVGA